MLKSTKEPYEVYCSFEGCDQQYSHPVKRLDYGKWVYACEDCMRSLLCRASFVFPEDLIISYVRCEDVEDAEANYRVDKEEQRRIRQQTPGWVYYIKVGDLIKIGFTTNLRSRLDSYPPDITVLAVHPGTPEVETRMHRKFRMSLERGREWFRPSLDINQHTKKARDDYGNLEDQMPDIFKYGRRWDYVA